jgi:hypothetical protein
MKSFIAIVLLLSVLPARGFYPDTTRAEGPHPGAAALRRSYGDLPLSFEVNRGQAAPTVNYLTRTSSYTVFFTPSEAVFVGHGQPSTLVHGATPAWGLGHMPQVRVNRTGSTIRLQFQHANPHPRIVGLDQLPGRVNYFIGDAPSRWRTDIPTFARVEYRNLYPGVDLVFYGRSQGELEYDWVLHPAARPANIRLKIAGARGVRFDRAGDLMIPSTDGALVQRAPQAYQETSGMRRMISARFALGPSGEVDLSIGRYDQSRPLIIDPVVSFATYLGGRQADLGYGITVDRSGDAIVVGDTVSNEFPLKNSLQKIVFAPNTPTVGYITKFDPTGTQLIYSTFFGGTNVTEFYGAAADSQGEVTFAGETIAQDFPTAHPFQRFYGGGGSDAIIGRLSAAGDQIIYSSYLGGSSTDVAYGIAVDAAGDAFMAGNTASKDFEVKKPLQKKAAGNTDAFVAEVSPAGRILWNTYLGGSQLDSASGVGVDAAGDVYVTGETQSPDFPVLNAIQTTLTGSANAFVTKIDPTGQNILYSTQLGGNDNNFADAIAVDPVGDAFITGLTSSTDFPARNAFQAHYGGQGASFIYGDAFVTKLDPKGQIAYSTFLGGHYDDWARAIAVDSAGAAYVTGNTDSADFPIKDAVQPAFQSAPCTAVQGKPYPCTNAFITKLDASGSLAWSTFWGGSRNTTGTGIAVDGSGAVYTGGSTESRDMNVVKAIEPVNTSTQVAAIDAYVLKLAPGTTTRDASSIVIDKLQILHKVQGKMLATSSIRVGENVEFMAAFHDKRKGSHPAFGTLIVWRGKKEIEQATMLSRGTSKKPSLIADMAFGNADGTGGVVAEFEIVSNPASSTKSVRFTIAAH